MPNEKKLIKINDKNFDDLIKGDKPVLVDFFATWCGPCQMMLPIINEIASEQDDFIVATLDIDENTAIAARYGVMSVPTFIVFKDGEEKSRMLGAMPKAMVVEKVKTITK